MTSRASKCARLLRVRAVEHRVAVQRLNDADAKLRNLLDVADRATALRTSLAIEPGQSDGWQIQAVGALSARLGFATESLNNALITARELKYSRSAARIVARHVEDHVARIGGAATHHEASIKEQRRSAALPTIHKIKARLAE